MEAEAGADLDKNSAQIWTAVSTLAWLHCCSASVTAILSVPLLQRCDTVCPCTRNWMVLVQLLNSPLKRQLLLSKTSPLRDISTDFFLQSERLCSTELCVVGGFFFNACTQLRFEKTKRKTVSSLRVEYVVTSTSLCSSEHPLLSCTSLPDPVSCPNYLNPRCGRLCNARGRG